jgi:hypothetical protein
VDAAAAPLTHENKQRTHSPMDKEDCLAHYPFVVVRIRCRVCARKGSYRLARIAAKHGPEITLRYWTAFRMIACGAPTRGPKREEPIVGSTCRTLNAGAHPICRPEWLSFGSSRAETRNKENWKMCNLYSETKGQASIRDWFRTSRDRTGNMPLFPAIFPDQMAPIIRNSADGDRELVMARWGMPGPPQFGGALITNIRNVGSPHWRGWLGKNNRCIIPATSFCEYADTKPRKMSIGVEL